MDEIFIKLLLATFLGGLVGLEREVHGRVAGLRTHILVCLGACLIMLTSLEFKGIQFADPSRVAAGVVMGIGFLGAGTIMHFRASVRGLTTAASLWVVAAMGLAVGANFYRPALLTAAVALITLLFLGRIENLMMKDWYKKVIIWSEDREGRLDEIKEVLRRNQVRILNFDLEMNKEKGELYLEASVRYRRADLGESLIREIGRIPGIRRIRWE